MQSILKKNYQSVTNENFSTQQNSFTGNLHSLSFSGKPRQPEKSFPCTLLTGRLKILEKAIGWLWGRASFLYGVFPFNIICGVLALAGLLMPAYLCIFMGVWTVAYIRFDIEGWIQHGPYLLLGFAIIGAGLYALYALFRFIFRKLRAAK